MGRRYGPTSPWPTSPLIADAGFGIISGIRTEYLRFVVGIVLHQHGIVYIYNYILNTLNYIYIYIIYKYYIKYILYKLYIL